MRQGPHHSAQKSTRTGTSAASTSLSKVVSVNVNVSFPAISISKSLMGLAPNLIHAKSLPAHRSLGRPVIPECWATLRQKGHLRTVFRSRFVPSAFLLIFAQALLLAGVAGPSSSVRADTGENGFGVSLTLFSTLAAINAAGYDAGIDSPINEHYKIRRQLREELAKLNVPSLTELKSFYKAHKRPSEAADLAQYISFAMIANGP